MVILQLRGCYDAISKKTTYHFLAVSERSLQIPLQLLLLFQSLLSQIFLPLSVTEKWECYTAFFYKFPSKGSVKRREQYLRHSTHLVLLSLSMIFFNIFKLSSGMLSRPCSTADIQFSMVASFSKVVWLVDLSSTRQRWTSVTFASRDSNIKSCRRGGKWN